MWGYISWVKLPWHFDTIRSDAGVTAVVKDIESHLPKTGGYYFPPMTGNYQDQADMEAYNELHRSGPSGMIFYTAEHREAMKPMVLVLGFCVDVAAAMYASLLLFVALPVLPTYTKRVVFVASLGIFSILSIRLMDGVFQHFPLRYTAGLVADTAITWTLAGIVLGALVRPRKSNA